MAIGSTLVHLAVRQNNLDCIKYLAHIQVDLNAKNIHGGSPLHSVTAIFSNNLSSLRAFIESGYDKNTQDSRGNTLLQNAIYFDKPMAINYLLDLRVDTSLKNNHGRTTLDMAMEKGNPNVVALLGTPEPCCKTCP